jgi:hypothetical protein
MKLRIFLFGRIIFMIIIMNCYQQEVISQINGSERWKQPGLFFGAGAGLTNAQIVNKATLSISNILSDRKASISGTLEIGYFFSKYFGLTSGANYTIYSSDLNIDSYQDQYNTVDRENESYDLQISGYDIEEMQKVDILSIPLCINMRMPLNKTIGFYLQTGINLLIPMSNNYETSGTFTYKGYFPAYNVLLENLPDYGFPTDLKIDSDGELELKPLSYGAIASAGIDYLIQKRVQVTFAAYYDKSLSDITRYSRTDEFHLITEGGKFNSILSGSSKTALQSMGLKLSLRYYLSDYTKFKYYYRPSSKRYLRENRR